MYISLLFTPRSLWKRDTHQKRVFRELWTPIFDCRESWTKEYLSRDPYPVIREITILFLEIREQGL